MLATPARAAIAFSTAACNSANATSVTVTVSTTAGDDVVVVASVNGSTKTVTSVTDTGGSSYAQRVAKTSANLNLEIWSARNAAASTSVTVNLSASGKVVACVGDYSGVAALGITASNGGSTATPTVSLTTQDNNNWVVGGFAAVGTATISANTGNLRANKVTAGGAAGSNVGGAITDNTSASPASVTNSITLSGAEEWDAAALELRSTTGGGGAAPKRLPLLGVG